MLHNLKTDTNGNTTIHQRLLMENPLSQEGFEFIMNIISNSNININQKNNDGLSYISLMMMHKELFRDITKSGLLDFIKSRSDLDLGPNDFGDTPLHYAAYSDNFSGIVFLSKLDSAARYVNTQNHNGQTAFHLAASKMNLVSMVALRDIMNADPNLKDEEGNTVGHRLILSLCAYPELGPDQVFTLLQAALKVGCDFTTVNNQGLSMVGTVIDQMSVAILDAMLATNPSLDINNHNTLGCFPLHLAVEKNDYYLAKHLVNKGINVNIKNDDGFTARELLLERANQQKWQEAFIPDVLETESVSESASSLIEVANNQLLEVKKLINS